MEGFFWVSGLLLLGSYSTDLLLAEVGRRSDIEAFTMQIAMASETKTTEPAVPVDPSMDEAFTNIDDSLLPEAPVEQPVAEVDLSTANPDQSLWSEKRIAAYDESTRHDTGSVIAILSMPDIDLETPIYNGDSDLYLDRGAGRISGTAMPGEDGNFGIAGHRDGFFRPLKDTVVGDELIIKTLNGPLRYEVTQTMIVEPTDVGVLRPTSESTVTLVTCYPFYFVGSAPQRFIVKAELKQEMTSAE